MRQHLPSPRHQPWKSRWKGKRRVPREVRAAISRLAHPLPFSLNGIQCLNEALAPFQLRAEKGSVELVVYSLLAVGRVFQTYKPGIFEEYNKLSNFGTEVTERSSF